MNKGGKEGVNFPPRTNRATKFSNHADAELDWERGRGELSPLSSVSAAQGRAATFLRRSGSGNLIVQGDNLVALKALLPYYAGQVKCIYIDPPYNTGNEGWVYNDNVNSPLIKEWLGKAVGKEAEDLSRHDKWLCMMYPRIALLRQFLRDDGVFIFYD